MLGLPDMAARASVTLRPSNAAPGEATVHWEDVGMQGQMLDGNWAVRRSSCGAKGLHPWYLAGDGELMWELLPPPDTQNRGL